MKQITRKIGVNRGKRRIWLEGKSLTFFGIHHGMRFNVINKPNQLLIHITADGARKVAGNPQRPVIDMTASTITASFADDVTVVSIANSGRGIVTLTGIKS